MAPKPNPPIPELDLKISFLINSPYVLSLCGHEPGNRTSFADKIELNPDRLKEDFHSKTMSEDRQKTLAKACKFDLRWPEWLDTEKEGRDTARHFETKYILSHAPVGAKSKPIEADFQPPKGGKSTPLTQSTKLDEKPELGFSLLARMELSDFVSHLDLSQVKTIRIIAATGESTVKHVLQFLQDAGEQPKNGNVQIQVLLTEAYMTDAGRRPGLIVTKQLIEKFGMRNSAFSIELRPYAAPATFRGVIVEHGDGDFSAFLSYYFWGRREGELERKSQHNANGFGLHKQKSLHPWLDVYFSWFRHFWGKSFINTIIFDFDDTIILTTNAQVLGWIKAIRSAIASGLLERSDLAVGFREMLDNDVTATKSVEAIFLGQQSEAEIFQAIILGAVSKEQQTFIREERNKVRAELTKNSPLIVDVVNDIKKLQGQYRFVIVSAASEQMVRDTLHFKEVELFSHIFGRNSERHDPVWREVRTKSRMFLRLSAMLGIPLDRMVFVGDSDADYQAANQVDLSYIENQCNAIDYGMPGNTLIKEPNANRDTITGKKPGELIKIIKEIEQRKLDKWRRLGRI